MMAVLITLLVIMAINSDLSYFKSLNHIVVTYPYGLTEHI